MNLVQEQILLKFGFLCALKALLGSQGIVVKCTAAIFFPTVDYEARRFSLEGNGTSIPALSRPLPYSATAIQPFCVCDG